MAVKTITVTEGAYQALKGMKAHQESFSETILRISRKNDLWTFAGAISKESADRLERTIMELRHRHARTNRKRIARIVKELEGR